MPVLMNCEASSRVVVDSSMGRGMSYRGASRRGRVEGGNVGQVI